LQIKDRAVIKIDSVAFGGEGVGRIDNLVTFVPFSAPGDELDIEITQRKKDFSAAGSSESSSHPPCGWSPCADITEIAAGVVISISVMIVNWLLRKTGRGCFPENK